MGKRSNFDRIPQDAYHTVDPRAVEILQPHLADKVKFAEPCVGKGYMVKWLSRYGHECVYEHDIKLGKDALDTTEEDLSRADMIITNPPYTRPLMHSMIQHFSSLRPTWLLLDADWLYTFQSADLVRERLVSRIALPRLRWIEGTKSSGKENSAWYLFDKNKTEDFYRGYGR